MPLTSLITSLLAFTKQSCICFTDEIIVNNTPGLPLLAGLSIFPGNYFTFASII